MSRTRKIIVEYEEAPFFDFGAYVVLWLIVGGAAFGFYAATLM